MRNVSEYTDDLTLLHLPQKSAVLKKCRKAPSLPAPALYTISMNFSTMQLRRLLVGFMLAAIARSQNLHITATVTPVPTTRTATPSCSKQACATYTNDCGIPYGGCFPACGGEVVPVFTPPPCPTTTTSTPLGTSSRCPTVCWDLINTCSMWYGGCEPMCGSYHRPSFTPPPCPTTTSTSSIAATITSLVPFSAASAARVGTYACSRTACWDYMNDCGLKYGGCHDDCDDSPPFTYADPGCPWNTTSAISLTTQTVRQCGMYCPLYVDGCHNTFGTGCYTSCPGMAPPSFTTPYCETSAVPTLIATTTA